MKLIIAIMRDSDTESVSQALVRNGYRVTRVASTGGFLRRGSTTLMVGTDEGKVDPAIEIIRANLGPISEPDINRANLFIINVEHFHQI